MAGERTYPILTVPDLEAAITFYEALGFRRTYLQLRPYPCAVVEYEDLVVHLSGVDGFDPSTSLGSVIITVPDAEALYATFAAGLRQAYGRLPVAGVPRILRPRRKQGTTTGFSLVDVGGNWLRIYRAGDTETEGADRSTGLARVVEVAARQGDSRGDDGAALDILDRGLARHPVAPAAERARALLYRAEILVRLGRHDEAAESFDAATTATSGDVPADLADEFAHVEELISDDR